VVNMNNRTSFLFLEEFQGVGGRPPRRGFVGSIACTLGGGTGRNVGKVRESAAQP